MALAYSQGMKHGYIQCRTPRQFDDDGLPVPAGTWENLTDEPVAEQVWQELLAESVMFRQGNTGIYADPAGMEYRFVAKEN